MIIAEHQNFYCVAGNQLDASHHAHTFIQLTILATPGQLTIENTAQSGQLFLTHSQQAHSINHTGAYLLILIDPASCLGKCIVNTHAAPEIHLSSQQALLEQLLSVLHTQEFEQVQAILSKAFQANTPVCNELDERIISTLNTLTSSPFNTPSLLELAKKVHLSPSRFSHLFSAQMGMPLKSYLRYLRFHHALPLLGKASLTEIALQCGFSDSAHFSRECKTLFGINPKQLKRAITVIHLR